jgi:hypothetical protein
MRVNLFTYIFVFLLSLSLNAQKKDSLKTNSLEENLSQNKKRKFLFFASDRMSEDGKYDIFKTIITDQNAGLMIARGHFEVADNPGQHKAKITVYNASSNNMVGIYNTNAYTGNYLLVLVPNVKYIFKVETNGYEVTEQEVEVPLKIDYEVCRQDIKIKRNEKGKTALFVNNFFSDGNEKVFFLKTSIDSTRKDAENAGYTDDESIKDIKQKPYTNVDDMVKKQLEEERKKPAEALKAFKAGDFETALPIYESLLKNDPKEPFLNYYCGVCLVKTNRNKGAAINHLEIASRYKDVPANVFLYLGKAYQLSYMFTDGYKALEEYKRAEKPTEINTSELSELMNNCRNGNALMLEQVNIEVLKRSNVDENNILAAYNPEQINDKLMYKTEFFNSAEDKKKNQKLLMYKIGKNEIIHVSYGAKEQSGTDLYKSNITPTGSFGVSQSLGIEINTSLDENYPYISKDGNTLYFSSKGHNSMGGYDIFMCTRTDAAATWSKPKNMGFPINSTYDDILYVPDTSGNFASFCSNRKNGKFELIQIKKIENAQPYSIIKGNFTTTDSIPNRHAIITVFNASTNEIAGVYKTNGETGNYLMALMAGTIYNIIVEADGYAELNNTFSVPEKRGDFVLKQSIQVSRENRNESMKVTNFFTEEQASKVVFEQAPKKIETKKEPVTHKEIKVAKPKRTPEEAEKDKQNLKLAKQLYEQATYQEAVLLYQELEVNINLDAINSYYYGISLYYSKKDKYRCVQALDYASVGKDVPIDVFYYLGKANHATYRFSAAIKSYQKFMMLAKPVEVKKLQVEQEIAHCENGIKLVNTPVVLEVFEKKHVDLETIHNAFTHLESGAKIMVSTDDIRSSIDRKKNYKPVIYLSPDKATIYFSSYGEDESNGKDIYRLTKLPGNKWSPAHRIESINSAFDEEYPALSADGKILYFSSKGFDCMGGYDIYKCNWNDDTQSWSAPINLGSPVNSPFDDIYYVE